jgi:hypothetical protein
MPRGQNLKDITGQRFGRLTVLEEAGRTKSGNARWLCRCDCGKEATVIGANLRGGTSQSCGCLRGGYSLLKNITGQKFGRLMVKQMMLERASNGHVLWLCECECGGEAIVAGSNLRDGSTNSCGCLRRASAQPPSRSPKTPCAAATSRTNVKWWGWHFPSQLSAT